MGTSRIVLMLLAAAGTAGAQQAQPAPAPHKEIGPATTTRPRSGYAASPPAPDTTRAARTQHAPVYYTQNGYGYVVTGAPFVVLADGSVAVNFGNGYERVLRACSVQAAPSTASDPFGRDALGRLPDPPGIAALRPGARGQVAGTMPAANAAACFRMDGQGRPEIVTK